MANNTDTERFLQRREERIAHAEKIAKIAETITDEQAEDMVSEQELCQKLPVFIRTKDGKRADADRLMSLAKLIRKNMAAEIILAKG